MIYLVAVGDWARRRSSGRLSHTAERLGAHTGSGAFDSRDPWDLVLGSTIQSLALPQL